MRGCRSPVANTVAPEERWRSPRGGKGQASEGGSFFHQQVKDFGDGDHPTRGHRVCATPNVDVLPVLPRETHLRCDGPVGAEVTLHPLQESRDPPPSELRLTLSHFVSPLFENNTYGHSATYSRTKLETKSNSLIAKEFERVQGTLSQESGGVLRTPPLSVSDTN